MYFFHIHSFFIDMQRYYYFCKSNHSLRFLYEVGGWKHHVSVEETVLDNVFEVDMNYLYLFIIYSKSRQKFKFAPESSLPADVMPMASPSSLISTPPLLP